MTLGPRRPNHARRIRAAFLTPTLLMGGAERWMISLARCCDRMRVEWTGTALTDHAPAREDLCGEMVAYMPVYAGPGAGPRGSSRYLTRCCSARAALDAAARNADVLITWGTQDLARLVDGYKIPIILVSHGAGPWSSDTVRSSESGATHFVAVSETAKTPFSSCARRNAHVIHNGIDVERCTPTKSRERIRASWGVGGRDRLIGYVGRYSAEKNPIAIAQAVARLGAGYRAIYAGSGWMEDVLRDAVARVLGTRAKFVRMTSQVGDVLTALDAFVLASPAEGFSLSLAEAWYCGVPVVATRVGAIPELESVYGPLVSAVSIGPSPDELARATELALTTDFKCNVVMAARDVVASQFTAGAMAARWIAFLESISR